MAKKPRISLDHEKVLLLTAVIELLVKLADIVIKAVSYDRGNPELQLQIQSARKAGVRAVGDRPSDRERD